MPPAAGAPPRARERPPPPVWLVVWVAMACEWLRGYMGGMFTGARIILGPRRPKHRAAQRLGFRASHMPTKPILFDPQTIDCEALGGEGDQAPPMELLITATEVLFPLLGAALSGWLTRRVGRRASVMAGIGLMCAGQLMAGVTANIVVYMVGADVYIAGSVLVLQAIIIEVVEVVPTPCRGRLAALNGVAAAVGFSLAALVILGIKLTELGFADWQWGFRLSLLLGMWPAFMLMCVVPWMLDTPGSLLQRGRLHEARQALQTLRGEFSDITEEYEAAARAVNAGKGRTQLSLLLDRAQRPGLVIAVVMGLLAGSLEPGWIMEPDTNLYGATEALIGMPVLYTSMLPGIADLIGATFCCLLIDRVGRRPLMTACAVAQGAMAAAAAGTMAHHRHLTKHDDGGGVAHGATILVCMYLLHIANSMGWYAADAIVVTELQNISARSAGVAIHMGTYLVVNRSLKHAMMHASCAAQLPALGAQVAIAAAAAVFAWCFIPETALTPLEDVARLRVYTHWFWKRFTPLGRRPTVSFATAARLGSGAVSGRDGSKGGGGGGGSGGGGGRGGQGGGGGGAAGGEAAAKPPPAPGGAGAPPAGAGAAAAAPVGPAGGWGAGVGAPVLSAHDEPWSSDSGALPLMLGDRWV